MRARPEAIPRTPNWHSITASYSGDAHFAPSTSVPVSQLVAKANTKIALSSSPSPSYVGQQVTFTARLSGLYGGTPTGGVTFKQGTTVLTTVGIVNGQASFTYTFSKSGKFVITAAYSGDSNFNAASKTIAQVVQKHTTTTSLTASPSPVNYAKTVTLTAGVATTGPTAPTGTVTFRNGTSIVGTSTLLSGKAVLQTAKLPVGSDTLTATYNGDALNAKSTSPALVEVVKQAKISMKLAPRPTHPH